MDRFVEIVNPAKVRSHTNAVVSGIVASKSEWDKHDFYPNKGVVGIVLGEGYISDGPILIIQCDNEIIVPILPDGVRDISLYEFRSRIGDNMRVGKATEEQKNNTISVDELMDSLDRMFGR
jgi:hypothetical protein